MAGQNRLHSGKKYTKGHIFKNGGNRAKTYCVLIKWKPERIKFSKQKIVGKTWLLPTKKIPTLKINIYLRIGNNFLLSFIVQHTQTKNLMMNMICM